LVGIALASVLVGVPPATPTTAISIVPFDDVYTINDNGSNNTASASVDVVRHGP
jgi:hypothetical protein